MSGLKERTEIAEMRFLRAVEGYRVTGHKRNVGTGEEVGITGINISSTPYENFVSSCFMPDNIISFRVKDYSKPSLIRNNWGRLF
jgi:hypothetical protein